MSCDGLFSGDSLPTFRSAWELYSHGRAFNEQLDLYNNVRTNEDFFIGKQWEGVRSNGLPTPVFNILKRDVCFVVSNITSDELNVRASPMAACGNSADSAELARILNDEFDAIFERNNITCLTREFARDAAVRGDGCLYTYWDPDMDMGNGIHGGIRSETLDNTHVYFGNPNDRRVESQPYIIIESVISDRDARREARLNGCENWECIRPDGQSDDCHGVRPTEDKVTTLLLMWRDEDSGEIWGYRCTRDCDIKRPWNMNLRRYPVVWLNWDYVPDCYHGQAMLTGLIPNQIFINKMWAMSMLSLMTTAYPKIVYDRTRIPRWTNQIGEAIGVNGGDVTGAARAIEPAAMSPQIAQYIDLAVEQTNRNLGATAAALGDTKPDNTSAIIALQRAAATPSEITKQNLRACLEDLARVYLEFIISYYGNRPVKVKVPAEILSVMPENTPEEVEINYDFSKLRGTPMSMKLDVGASSYYSEIAAIQTLDNLLMADKITTKQYLERVPDGYIPDRKSLISESE